MRHVALLLLLWMSLTAAADNGVVRTGCRRGNQAAAARQLRQLQRVAPPRTPMDGNSFYRGTRRQLVVMTAFQDKAFREDEASTLLLWDRIFNEADLREEPFVGSVHDYFYDQSYSALDLVFDIVYITLPGTLSKYHSTDEDDENSQFLVNDIVDVLMTFNLDWSVYDWNDDGYVDQLLIVYAGMGQNSGGGSNTIWPHQWWLSAHIDPVTEQPCQPRTVSYGGEDYVIDCYCAVQELESDGSYGSFGSICHEYSHCLGLPDFYYGSKSFIFDWDLMDEGNYNGDGFCPAGYSAHERWVMGWMELTELTEPASVTGLAALGDEPQAYLIRNDGYKNEYYIVENRQPTRWDACLPGKGLVVFHVDYDADLWVSTEEWTNTTERQHYVVIAANGLPSRNYCSGWAYPTAYNDALTDEGDPQTTLWHFNTDGTIMLGKPLTNMAVTEGLASFDFMGGTTAVDVSRTGGSTPCVYYDLQGRQVHHPRAGQLYVVRDGHGQVKKVYGHAK